MRTHWSHQKIRSIRPHPEQKINFKPSGFWYGVDGSWERWCRDECFRIEEMRFEYEVIPGISSIQALTARHRIPLNRIGASVHVTPGRRLSEELPADADDVVVLLDGECSFKKVKDSEVDIYWGAYLGTPDEILVSGNLQQRMDEIERVRTQARAKKGWIMDAYLLRKTSTAR